MTHGNIERDRKKCLTSYIEKSIILVHCNVPWLPSGDIHADTSHVQNFDARELCLVPLHLLRSTLAFLMWYECQVFAIFSADLLCSFRNYPRNFLRFASLLSLYEHQKFSN